MKDVLKTLYSTCRIRFSYASGMFRMSALFHMSSDVLIGHFFKTLHSAYRMEVVFVCVRKWFVCPNCFACLAAF